MEMLAVSFIGALAMALFNIPHAMEGQPVSIVCLCISGSCALGCLIVLIKSLRG